MRKKSFKINHDDFETWILVYGDLMKRLIGAKHIVRTKFEKMELLEALVLRCAARWERLVEEDIITSLNRASSGYAKELGLKLRPHLSRDEALAMLVGHRYLDFRGVNEVKNFAKKHLVAKYNPFKTISKSSVKRIDDFLAMRNLLAHYSTLSWRNYRRLMKSKFKYRRVPEPGAFLIRINPKTKEYRWAEYLTTFLDCSHKMRRTV
jgi:hypothetical protein